jgi:hypothetical protein
MLKKIVITCAISLLSLIKGVAQTAVYDIVSYDEPAGWIKKEDTGYRSYTMINSQKGTYGMIVIYPAIKSSGDAEKDLTDSWDQLVKTTFKTGSRPDVTRSERADGYSVLVSGTESIVKGKSTVVLLVDFTGYGKTVSVVLNYSDESFSTYITAFLKTIQFTNVDKRQDTSQTTVQTPSSNDFDWLGPTKANIGNNSTAALIGDEGVSGLWMSMVAQTDFMYSGISTSLKCIAVFTNGQLRENLPIQGYRYFDYDEDRRLFPGNWGTYKGSLGSYTVEKNGAPLYHGKLSVTDNNKIKFDGDSYMRVRPFNNLKLKGSWTSLANPDETVVIDDLEPVIYFSEDGRFDDKGILFALDITASRVNQRGGKGSYEIKDYTLSLHYDDGRIRNYSITGLFTSAEQSDKTLIVGNVTLRKRSG